MRTMYDSITPSAIPSTAALVAGYVDGAYAWSMADWARFPRSVKVRIAVFSRTNDGHVLDVEQGDATPAQAPGWVAMRRSAGVDPSIYCNASTWPAVVAAFQSANVKPPHYWIAAYDGSPVIPAGAIAKQYNDPPGSGGNYDISVVADYWPGVDPLGGNSMKNLVIGQAPGDPAIWVGDGITRRHIPDSQTLADMQYMIQQAGGDPTIKTIADLWVLGDPAQDVQSEVNAEAVTLLAAIKAQPTGGQVDVAALTTSLAGPLAAALAPLTPPGVTPAELLHAMGAALTASP